MSKQTVYKHFADKERLFGDVVTGIGGTVDAFIADATATRHATADLRQDLRDLARRYAVAVMQPDVLQVRRLMIGEANRFPDLGRAYYERAPERVFAALAAAFDGLAKRGLLRLADPLLAAKQFAFLVLSIPLDRELVCGDEERQAGRSSRRWPMRAPRCSWRPTARRAGAISGLLSRGRSAARQRSHGVVPARRLRSRPCTSP